MFKIGRNDPCPCNSGKKYKKCCMNKTVEQQEVGTLKRLPVLNNDDFYARFIFQFGQIRDCCYSREDRLAYDKSFKPVFQNLLEAKLSFDKFEEIISNHIKDIESHKDAKFHDHQIDVISPIDTDLNLHFKDFFIRGSIAIDCLIRHTIYMGYGIGFLFVNKDDKKYKKGLARFPIDKDDSRFKTLSEFIDENKVIWYEKFNDLRNAIEHDGWTLPGLKYKVNKSGKTEAVFPTFNGQSLNDVVNISWNNLSSLCEEVLAFIFSLKLNGDIMLVFIPEEKRDKHFPVKYAVRHKAFPEANFSCS